jgi:DNA polymerase I-like protein with 3'-5' exonuclease and polymerase domains
MLDAFIKRKDIHTVMAQLWFQHKPDYEENAKKYRKLGKNVSYGR